MMRLQKFLAQAGVASRRQAEELIKEGQIKVNGETVTTLGTSIDENSDQVTFNDRPVTLEQKKVYYALHKPLGYVSSTSNNEGKSVLSLVKAKQRIYPVGRLDIDSSGLILLTNDGEFTNQITHARFGCQKEYFVTLDQDLRPEDIKKLTRGLRLGGQQVRGIKVVSAKNRSARLVLKEGINRQIRRMLGKLGYTVIKLKRIRIGRLELGDLEPGQYKNIKPKDVI